MNKCDCCGHVGPNPICPICGRPQILDSKESNPYCKECRVGILNITGFEDEHIAVQCPSCTAQYAVEPDTWGEKELIEALEKEKEYE